MSTVKPQAISGVSAGIENTLDIVYPSIACTGLGRWLGRWYDCIPLKVNGIKLSTLLFALPSSPLAVIEYFRLKIDGDRYVLTNRSIQRWRAWGEQLVGQASLTEIDEIEIERRPGQAFYRAGDLLLRDSGGNLLVRLDGVPHPERFRQIILEARDAHRHVEASLATIEARQPA